MSGAVSKRWDLACNIKLCGAPAAGASIAVGTNNPFADSVCLGLRALFINKVMRHKLVVFRTIMALKFVLMAIQRQGEAM